MLTHYNTQSGVVQIKIQHLSSIRPRSLSYKRRPRVFTEAEILEINARADSGELLADLAVEFKLTITRITAIRFGFHGTQAKVKLQELKSLSKKRLRLFKIMRSD